MNAESLPILLGALILGFVGSGHCIGMCGGIAGALGQRPPGSKAADSLVLSSLLYSLGRVGSYSLLGAIVGLLGESVHWLAGTGPSLRVLTGILIVFLGLRAAGWGISMQRLERG